MDPPEPIPGWLGQGVSSRSEGAFIPPSPSDKRIDDIRCWSRDFAKSLFRLRQAPWPIGDFRALTYSVLARSIAEAQGLFFFQVEAFAPPLGFFPEQQTELIPKARSSQTEGFHAWGDTAGPLSIFHPLQEISVAPRVHSGPDGLLGPGLGSKLHYLVYHTRGPRTPEITPALRTLGVIPLLEP